MSFEVDLTVWLEGYAGLSALVGSRVYPIMLPQEPTLPALTYMVVDDPPEYSHSGYSNLTSPRVQLDVWAASQLEVIAVTSQLRKALNAWHTAGGNVVLIQDGGRDMPEPETGRFRRVVDVIVRRKDSDQ